MDLFEALLTRRSVRDYTDEPVPEEAVERLLRAAMAAPSARNQQPWRFVVVRDRQVLTQMAKVSPNGAMIGRAQVALLICAGLDLVKSEGFWIQDCAAATQNSLLAAHAMGLGAVWCGIYPRETRVAGVRRIFDLPEQIVPFAIVAVGYPKDPSGAVDRFDPTRVCLDRYEEAG
jgi:nitroreductase